MNEFENGQVTPWGYIADAEVLPNFLSDIEYNNFTNGKFAKDTMVQKVIPSATEAIRNYCGWHISPSLTCGMFYNIRDLRDAFVGRDLLVQLPATYVTAIQKIIVDAVWNADKDDWDGEELTDYDIGMGAGLLRIYDVGCRDRKSRIFIKYTAGFPNVPEVIKELTADRVTHAVANPYGVASESAGGVSVSYSSIWASGSNASSLSNDSHEILEQYKVKGVF